MVLALAHAVLAVVVVPVPSEPNTFVVAHVLQNSQGLPSMRLLQKKNRLPAYPIVRLGA